MTSLPMSSTGATSHTLETAPSAASKPGSASAPSPSTIRGALGARVVVLDQPCALPAELSRRMYGSGAVVVSAAGRGNRWVGRP